MVEAKVSESRSEEPRQTSQRGRSGCFQAANLPPRAFGPRTKRMRLLPKRDGKERTRESLPQGEWGAHKNTFALADDNSRPYLLARSFVTRGKNLQCAYTRPTSLTPPGTGDTISEIRHSRRRRLVRLLFTSTGVTGKQGRGTAMRENARNGTYERAKTRTASKGLQQVLQEEHGKKKTRRGSQPCAPRGTLRKSSASKCKRKG